MVADQLKALRDITVFAFIMINSLFVLIMFLLQINKDKIHVVWPLNPKDYILFDLENFEISIAREYLHLDPLGLCLVVFFGSVLIVQFLAMLVHRFETISEILATTQLDWYCNKKVCDLISFYRILIILNFQVKDTVVSSEIKENAVAIARKLQKPKSDFVDDDEDDDYAGSKGVRRDTIQRLLLRNRDVIDYSNLEANFKRELYREGELNLGKISVSRKTLNILNEKRKSLADSKKVKTEAISDPYMVDPYGTSLENAYNIPNNWNDDDSDITYQRPPMRPPSMISLDETFGVSRRQNGGVLKKSSMRVQLQPPENEYTYAGGFDNGSFLNDYGELNKQNKGFEEIELVVPDSEENQSSPA